MSNRRKVSRINRNIKQIGIIITVIMGICISNVFFTMATGKHFRSGVNVKNFIGDSASISNTVYAKRGNIYDCNKEVIAQDVEAYNMYAIIDKNRINEGSKPAYVQNFQQASDKLAPILGCKSSELMKYFKSAEKRGAYQTEFGNIGKKISVEQRKQIEKTGVTGLEFIPTTDRIYPEGKFASHLIGYTESSEKDNDTHGVMGIEKILDSKLHGVNGELAYQIDSNGNYLPDTKNYKKVPSDGNDIYLTIDKDVQMTLEKSLSSTVENTNALRAWGIVINAKTGAILAQSGYPTFDLNKRDKMENYYNLPSEWVFEPGSIMKPFIYAAAMNEGVYNGEKTFKSGSAPVALDKNGKPYRVDEKGGGPAQAVINDALGINRGYQTFDQGLVYSLNTGIVSLLCDYLGVDKEYEYLKKFGFNKSVDIKGVHENLGTLIDRNGIDQVMTGFGQASTVNSYQMIQAYTALFGDGRMVKPYLVDKIVDPNTGKVVYKGETKKSDQVISASTAKKMRKLMEKVVTDPNGTGAGYKMDDIKMAAKTGTGEIAMNGGYSKKYFTSSIAAGMPADDPEIVILYCFQSSKYLGYDTKPFKNLAHQALLAVNGYNKVSDKDKLENRHENSTEFKEYTMQNFVNHSLEYASEKLQNNDTNKVVIGDGKSIVDQFPKAGSTIFTNQNIFLLTDGTNIKVPDMKGWSRRDVEAFAKLTGIDAVIKGSGLVYKQSDINQNIDKNTKLTVELK